MCKRFLHPVVGLLRLDFTHLWLGPRSELVLKSYSPADPETVERLEKLQAMALENEADAHGRKPA